MRELKIKGIAATLHLPQAKKPSVIIMCHGFASCKNSLARVEIAKRLCAHGFAVLRFDFYGHGKSHGKLENFTISKGLEDLDAVLNWVERQENLNSEKIGVQGSSLGGTIAMLKAAEDKRIKCLVTWGSPIRFSELLTGEMIESFQQKGFFQMESGIKIGKDLYDDMKRHVVARAVEKITIPLLIIHGKKDDVVHFGNALDIYKFAKGPKKLELIDDARHDLKKIPRVFNLTADWLKKWLSSK